jgi:hypothetical protein
MPSLGVVMPNMGISVCQIEAFSIAGQFLLCFSAATKGIRPVHAHGHMKYFHEASTAAFAGHKCS